MRLFFFNKPLTDVCRELCALGESSQLVFRNETMLGQARPLAVVIVPAPKSQQRFARGKINIVLSYVSRTSKP